MFRHPQEVWNIQRKIGATAGAVQKRGRDVVLVHDFMDVLDRFARQQPDSSLHVNAHCAHLGTKMPDMLNNGASIRDAEGRLDRKPVHEHDGQKIAALGVLLYYANIIEDFGRLRRECFFDLQESRLLSDFWSAVNSIEALGVKDYPAAHDRNLFQTNPFRSFGANLGI